MFKWLTKLFPPLVAFEPTEAHRLRIAFEADPQANVERVIAYFNTAPKFRNVLGLYISRESWVTVENDIYGYAVKMPPNGELLDCCPEAYGLTQEQGKRLYQAILSCVPGSSAFKERFYKELEEQRGP